MNLGEVLLAALEARGAREIFGIPGDFALPFFRIIEESGRLPLYTLSHEPAIGFAADASARFRCGLGVAAVTYGAGAFNLVNATACAYAERSPVVVISAAPGRAEAESGLLIHHQGPRLDSQMRIFAEITVAQTRLDDPHTAPSEIARVLDAARACARPVYIEIPRDVVGEHCAPAPPPADPAVDRKAAQDCAERVLERLARAERPVIMVGVEVRRYGLEAQVAELARRLRLPVVTSFMGRGLLAGAGAPLAGTYLGRAGDPRVRRLVEESDGLMLLGVIVSDSNFAVAAGAIDLESAIHAFDGELRFGGSAPLRVPLAALVEALLERARPVGGADFAPVRPAHPRGLPADDAPLAPGDLAPAINDLFARHGSMPIASDIGDCLFVAMEIEETPLVGPGYYAGMGFGVPAGIGGQLATARRTLVLVGDGAFQMTGFELGHCRRLGIDPIVLVLNNAGWEMLRAFAPGSRFNDLDEWNFAALARDLGGDGYRVRTRRELVAALDRAAATRGRFQLIEAMLPRGAVSDTLARFVAGQPRPARGPQEG